MKNGIKLDSTIFVFKLNDNTYPVNCKHLTVQRLTKLAFLGTVATKTVRIALVGHHI